MYGLSVWGLGLRGPPSLKTAPPCVGRLMAQRRDDTAAVGRTMTAPAMKLCVTIPKYLPSYPSVQKFAQTACIVTSRLVYAGKHRI